MKKKIIIIILALISAGVLFGLYMYNKPHQSIRGEDADFSVEAGLLAREFAEDEPAANAKYLGKIVEVRGLISEIYTDEQGKPGLILSGQDMTGIGCQFEKSEGDQLNSLNTGDDVKVKGICTGMLMDVVLVDCVIEKE